MKTILFPGNPDGINSNFRQQMAGILSVAGSAIRESLDLQPQGMLRGNGHG